MVRKKTKPHARDGSEQRGPPLFPITAPCRAAAQQLIHKLTPEAGQHVQTLLDSDAVLQQVDAIKRLTSLLLGQHEGSKGSPSADDEHGVVEAFVSFAFYLVLPLHSHRLRRHVTAVWATLREMEEGPDAQLARAAMDQTRQLLTDFARGLQGHILDGAAAAVIPEHASEAAAQIDLFLTHTVLSDLLLATDEQIGAVWTFLGSLIYRYASALEDGGGGGVAAGLQSLADASGACQERVMVAMLDLMHDHRGLVYVVERENVVSQLQEALNKMLGVDLLPRDLLAQAGLACSILQATRHTLSAPRFAAHIRSAILPTLALTPAVPTPTSATPLGPMGRLAVVRGAMVALPMCWQQQQQQQQQGQGAELRFAEWWTLQAELFEAICQYTRSPGWQLRHFALQSLQVWLSCVVLPPPSEASEDREEESPSPSASVRRVIELLLDCLVSHWDHPHKPTQQASRNIWDAMLNSRHQLAALAQQQDSSLLRLMCERVIRLPSSSKKSQYLALCALLPHVGPSRLLEWLPSLIPQLLASLSEQPVAAAARLLLQKVISGLVKAGEPLHVVLPVLAAALTADGGDGDEDRAAVVASSVGPLLEKLDPSALAPLVRSIVGESTAWSVPEAILLQVARRGGVATWHQQQHTQAAAWRLRVEGADAQGAPVSYEIPLDRLLCGLQGGQESLRQALLELAVAAPGTTTPFIVPEGLMLRHTVRHSLKASTADGRVQCGNAFRKGMCRARDGVRKAMERMSEPELRAAMNGHASSGTDLSDLSTTLSLLASLHEQLLSFLFPGQPFDRCHTALDLLAILHDVWGQQGGGLTGSHSTRYGPCSAGNVIGLYSHEAKAVLVRCLSSTWERQRQVALKLLGGFPCPLPIPPLREGVGVGGERVVACFVEECVLLLQSVRGRDYSAGECLMKLLFTALFAKYDTTAPSDSLQAPTTIPSFPADLLHRPLDQCSPADLSCIRHAVLQALHTSLGVPSPPQAQLTSGPPAVAFLSCVVEGIRQRQRRLSANNGPNDTMGDPSLALHGLVRALGACLGSLPRGGAAAAADWRPLVKGMVEALLGMCVQVFSIIAEGADALLLAEGWRRRDHTADETAALAVVLPTGASFRPGVIDCRGHPIMTRHDDTAADESAIDMVNEENVLVVGSWLSVKEVGETLMALLDWMPFCDSEGGGEEARLLTPSELDELGRQLLTLLVAVRHPGAMDRLAAAWTSLAQKLMCSGSVDLCHLPSTWLDTLLNLLLPPARWHHQGSNAPTSTLDPDAFLPPPLRRSRSLGLAFVALLRGEPPSLGSVLLPRAMSALLEITSGKFDAEFPATLPDRPAACRVHAINALRALLLSGYLTSSTRDFLGGSLEAAMEGLRSDSWLVRNASTMLYVTIVRRLLSADNESIEVSPKGFLFCSGAESRAGQMAAKTQCGSLEEILGRQPHLLDLLLAHMHMDGDGGERGDTTNGTGSGGSSGISGELFGLEVHGGPMAVLLLLSRGPLTRGHTDRQHEDTADGRGDMDVGSIMKATQRCLSSKAAHVRILAARALANWTLERLRNGSAEVAATELLKAVTDALAVQLGASVSFNHVHGSVHSALELLSHPSAQQIITDALRAPTEALEGAMRLLLEALQALWSRPLPVLIRMTALDVLDRLLSAIGASMEERNGGSSALLSEVAALAKTSAESVLGKESRPPLLSFGPSSEAPLMVSASRVGLHAVHVVELLETLQSPSCLPGRQVAAFLSRLASLNAPPSAHGEAFRQARKLMREINVNAPANGTVGCDVADALTVCCVESLKSQKGDTEVGIQACKLLTETVMAAAGGGHVGADQHPAEWMRLLVAFQARHPRHPRVLKAVLLTSASILLHTTNPEAEANDLWDPFSQWVLRCSDPKSDIALRMAAVDAIGRLSACMREKKGAYQLCVWRAVVALLQDEVPHVRDAISRACRGALEGVGGDGAVTMVSGTFEPTSCLRLIITKVIPAYPRELTAPLHRDLFLNAMQDCEQVASERLSIPPKKSQLQASQPSTGQQPLLARRVFDVEPANLFTEELLICQLLVTLVPLDSRDWEWPPWLPEAATIIDRLDAAIRVVGATELEDLLGFATPQTEGGGDARLRVFVDVCSSEVIAPPLAGLLIVCGVAGCWLKGRGKGESGVRSDWCDAFRDWCDAFRDRLSKLCRYVNGCDRKVCVSQPAIARLCDAVCGVWVDGGDDKAVQTFKQCAVFLT
ncbi:unnamed protein product [Vitrella brassicaformis CCMP3155]|uniref:DUF2428 domain-containing protein n=3 Tax=Vitrella brassicaformis TaxID=1169539 RepID=A0A0G4G170_VITBC|nr:unnamed protein product [Vitrella brassicaformis CCMP3155]|eukprot:CEM21233.1 unnamed protein product [Vitrella brassicaformis CCMP3155]